MVKIPVSKLKDGTVRVALPFESVTPIITIETKRQDKFTSVSVYPLGHMSIEESAIILHVLDYLLYNTTNNLEIANEIVIDEHTLQKDVLQRNSSEDESDEDEVEVIIYKRHDGSDREELISRETLLVRDNVVIKLFFNDGDFTNYKELFNVELKFYKPLSKTESLELAQFVTYVTYKMCVGDYYSGECVQIYGGGKHIFDGKLIKTFVENCKKSWGYLDLKDELDISELEEFIWDDWSEYDICD